MITQVTSALAGHLAAGGLLLAGALSLFHRLPVGFLRFCAASSFLLSAFAAMPSSSEARTRLAWVGLSAAAAIWYLALRARGDSPKPVALLAAATALVSALTAGGGASSPEWVAILGSLSSALLLGSVAVTMVLGHWYLVDTRLSIAPLRDGALWVAAAVAARWVAVVAALSFGGWEMLRVARAADVIFSTNGLFFLFRSLMGLGAPLLLAGLIWQTVKIRSTQSATGLLYVLLILVLFGELISSFLRVATGHPL
ncbi:MAG TPA: hypothetical protein VIE88_09820 [Vicinamibacteria bacterium]